MELVIGVDFDNTIANYESSFHRVALQRDLISTGAKKTKEEIAEGRSKAAAKQIKDFDGLIARITKPMKKTEIVNLAIDNGHGSYYLVNKHWKKVEARLLKNKDGLFLNPEQKT